ncbi:Ger(x)C family spore germination protein [Bacillus sp. FJAT-50079]|uniref:Ger(x)C family spore germination protein n=1 Tax=Bacillus sp. FJAT-50079 TaxID=2833577 RepID=UPI001BC9398B|nr:Ger(x)C family spore germination protein [Bacillus sp. FJAT-50079]MBS4210264.1 Ger(x)C family spore germination protein [Bacillus sp. FJAT-50079]
MKALKILLISMIPLLLSGCWGKLELEERDYAVVIGLDKAKEDHLIDVTFQVANPQVGSSDTSTAENEPPSDIVTVTAPDLLSAKELVNSVLSRKVSFDHLRIIIIGEDLAKTKLSHHIIGSAVIDPEVRRENNLIVTKERASEFIKKNKPKLETRPHKYYAFMQQRWRDTGYVPYSNLTRYFQRLSGELFLAIYATTEKEEKLELNEDDYVAGEIPQKSGDPAQIMGSAVLKNGKMIGTLTGQETRTALFLRPRGLAHSVIQSFPDPIKEDYRITVRMIKNGSTKVKINTKGDVPDINVTVPIRIQVLSNPSLTDYAIDIGKQTQLKKAIKKDLEKQAMNLIKRTQTEFKSEPFLWYLEARRTFWTIKDYDNYDWTYQYSKANVNVHYKIKIESLGEQLVPETIKKIPKE